MSWLSASVRPLRGDRRAGQQTYLRLTGRVRTKSVKCVLKSVRSGSKRTLTRAKVCTWRAKLCIHRQGRTVPQHNTAAGSDTAGGVDGLARWRWATPCCRHCSRLLHPVSCQASCPGSLIDLLRGGDVRRGRRRRRAPPPSAVRRLACVRAHAGPR